MSRSCRTLNALRRNSQMSRAVSLTALLSIAPIAIAQSQVQQATDSASKSRPLAAVTVTATRSQRSTFDTPQAITVLDSSALRAKLPHSAVDLFRDIAGLDASGVGPSQRRPEIRGMRGQRILLLEDGLRLNNSRRQQDFGELPAIAGISGIDRVDVVRGPASVLYGTDAIGGVVNIITAPLPSVSDGIHGWAGFRYSSADQQQTPSAGLEGRFGRFAFRASGGYRDTKSYDAPSGRFGDISFEDEVKVNDTGVRDYSYNALAGWDLGKSRTIWARAERYTARDAGFGYVANSDLGANAAPTIQMTYPDQDVQRYSLGWRALSLGTPVADRAEVTTYLQDNTRHLDLDVFVPFGRGLPPTAGVTSAQRNWTDMRTLGVRAEATKLVGGRTLLTYGADAFQD